MSQASRDDAVGAAFVFERRRERDQRIGAARRLDRVDGLAEALVVEREAGPPHAPTLSLRAPDQRAQEAQPRRMRSAEPRQPHHLVGRPQRHEGHAATPASVSTLASVAASTVTPSAAARARAASRRAPGKPRLAREGRGDSFEPRGEAAAGDGARIEGEEELPRSRRAARRSRERARDESRIGPGEAGGEHLDHQRGADALVAAGRRHRALQRLRGVRRRLALGVERPARRDRLAGAGALHHLALGDDAGALVDDKSRAAGAVRGRRATRDSCPAPVSSRPRARSRPAHW